MRDASIDHTEHLILCQRLVVQNGGRNVDDLNDMSLLVFPGELRQLYLNVFHLAVFFIDRKLDHKEHFFYIIFGQIDNLIAGKSLHLRVTQILL